MSKITYKGSKLKVAYDHFTDMVKPPFILYRNTDTTTFSADNKTYFKHNRYIIDLATEIKNVDLEGKVEEVLNNNCLPYDKEENFIDSERIFQIRYFI